MEAERRKMTHAEHQAPLALTRSIALIGLMGCGKSSVGWRLAETLGVGFNDVDTEIERAANMTIAEIFERYGEAHFRDGERRVIARLIDDAPQVIATGGGAFMDKDTRRILKERAVVIWLRADLDVLVQRTAGRTHRPILNAGDPRTILRDLMERRHPIYGEAHITVQSYPDQSHKNVVNRIIKALTRDGRAFGEQV